ncbi:MAG: type IX secretion system protein PorQ [Verrucomicrobia bacterium]|nr:type IX secretion system protein PorQ [Cytophagales bacterium]
MFLFPVSVFAQIGGQQTFTFLNLPQQSRLAGLGLVNISSGFKEDATMFVANPALLHKDFSGEAAVSYLPLYGNIKHSNLSYVQNFNKAGVFAANLQYVSYGTFEETDPTGAVIGSFQASEFALGITHARTLENYTMGLTAKIAGSQIANVNAYAVLFDFGTVFKHPTKDLTVALVIKNAGFNLKKYRPDLESNLPFDVQIGTSFKPEKMPVRFSITAYKLTRFNIAYDDPTQNLTPDINGNLVREEVSFSDKLFRHFAFGTEFILSKNFNLRAGYNYLVRRELRLQSTSGGAGFSLGFMLKVKAFSFAYSRAWYHVAGAANSLTLITDTKSFIKKK